MPALTIQQAFDLALQHHRAGRLQEAEQLYRQIVAQQPTHVESIHNLGLIAHRLGRNEVASDLLRRAIELRPNSAAAHSNLGDVLRAGGRIDEAIAAYRKAIALNPRLLETLCALGNVLNDLAQRRTSNFVGPALRAVSFSDAETARSAGPTSIAQGHLRNKGLLDEAVAVYRQAIAIAPQYAEAHNNLGVALGNQGRLDESIAAFHQAIFHKEDFARAHSNLSNALREKGELDEAIASARRAIALDPQFSEAHNNLGNALKESGRFDESISAYRQAVLLTPDFAEAHSNLGNALKDNGRLDEAIAAYGCAIQLNPTYAEAHCNLGIALKEKGLVDSAIAAYRQAIVLRPAYAEAHCNLGVALNDKGEFDEGIAEYRRTIACNRSLPDAHFNLANAVRDKGQIDEAIAEYEAAIALKPDYPQAFSNLGNALKDGGRLDEAIGAFRHAMSLKPDFPAAHSNLIYTMHFHPGYGVERITEEQRRWSKQFAEPLRNEFKAHTNDRSPNRRLKIGYVSPDFRTQAECYFVVPLLQAHDHENFEIHCYSSVSAPDRITQIIKDVADVWHDVAHCSDEELARRIAADRIDILVDLTMHMARNRLLTFARKPAPVQVTWLAYPGSTGLSTIDYRITDAHMDPPGANPSGFSEAPIHMPDCWVTYSPLEQLAPPNPPPAVGNGFITFGSMNNPCKLNDGVLRQWARIMGAASRSRLAVLAASVKHREQIMTSLEANGIERSRVTFFSFQNRKEYLANYRGIDIGLDPFPYNGITTTCDALQMGVPVFTLPGATPASRAGMGLLSAAGLSEFIASSEDDLISKIAVLAHDIGRLTSLRETLRDRVASSPLMDARRFAANLEAAYRRMWRSFAERKIEH